MHDGSSRAKEGEPGQAVDISTLRIAKKKPRRSGARAFETQRRLFATAALLILLVLRRRVGPACAALTAGRRCIGAALTAARGLARALVLRRALAPAAAV